MKKVISVRELQEYLKCHKVNSVVFYTENQRWYCASDPCKIRMSFPIMLINENPNLICLKSGVQSILFDRVKAIEIDTDSTVLGTIFTVFCGDFNTEGYDTTYTLIVA